MAGNIPVVKAIIEAPTIEFKVVFCGPMAKVVYFLLWLRLFRIEYKIIKSPQLPDLLRFALQEIDKLAPDN